VTAVPELLVTKKFLQKKEKNQWLEANLRFPLGVAQ
jgi:hypothetical protein